MARRKRDYKAEERRRNELARQRGFTTRAAERGAKKRQDYKRAGFASHGEYVRERQRAKQWAREHSGQSVSAYPAFATPEQVADYLNAFVDTRDHVEHIHYLSRYLHDNFPEDYPPPDDDEYWKNY